MSEAEEAEEEELTSAEESERASEVMDDCDSSELVPSEGWLDDELDWVGPDDRLDEDDSEE